MTLHRPAGSAARDGDPLVITPESAGWRFAALRVLRLAPGEARALDSGDLELAVLPLSARGLTVTIGGERFELRGRASVFERVSDFAYAPPGTRVEIASATGGEVALPAARARERLAPYYGPAGKVPVEVRGAGPATRQVTNFLTPGTAPASTLCAVEVLTPAGNWSSYPPHKHDEASEHEAVLEEIYYFRVPGGAGFALHRTYTADGAIDETAAVRDGDAFLVPRGYHGPTVAAPGYPLWYLNVLGGPGPERTMAFRDDPAHHWVRASWAGQAPDPRCPMTSASGPVPQGG